MTSTNYIFIKSNKNLIKLRFDDMLFIKGLGNYVELYLINQNKHVYYKSLKELIDVLPDEFMRIHNSYIINLKNVDYIKDNHVIMGDHKITIAKSHKDCLLQQVNKLLL